MNADDRPVPTRRRRAGNPLAAALLCTIILAPVAPSLAAQSRDGDGRLALPSRLASPPAELSPDSVRAVQKALRQGGYDVGSADGVWGPRTNDALRHFQRVQGLEPTGLPDARTLEVLGVGPDAAANARGGFTSPQAQRGGGGFATLGGDGQSRGGRDAAATPGHRHGSDGGASLPTATVRMIQHALMQGGYDVAAADGNWTDRTTAALREFQRVKGMKPSGTPDAATLSALGVPATATVARPAQPENAGVAAPALPADTVRTLQRALADGGYGIGSVDGVWGPQTEAALRRFQRTAGLPASGRPDPQSLAALGVGGGARDASVSGRATGEAAMTRGAASDPRPGGTIR